MWVRGVVGVGKLQADHNGSMSQDGPILRRLAADICSSTQEGNCSKPSRSAVGDSAG